VQFSTRLRVYRILLAEGFEPWLHSSKGEEKDEEEDEEDEGLVCI
jgi:hypothetical protein